MPTRSFFATREFLRPPPRVPAFHAVPTRQRKDGWTPLKQAEFIGFLAQTRSIAAAAREVGMTRETAYRLRRRKWADSFIAAWDAALGVEAAEGQEKCPRKVTFEELEWRAETGTWRIILREGRYRGVRHKVDVSAICAITRRLGSASRRGMEGTAKGHRPD